MDSCQECTRQRDTDLRRRCHDMVDKLTDPAIMERARRFLTYLYVYRQADEKSYPDATYTETARAD